MKKLLALLFVFSFVLFTTSCGEDEPIEVLEEVVEDNPDSEITAADTSSTGVYQEEVEEGPTSLQDAMAGDKEPVVEEGGMSFCDCVKKNKELQDIMMADDATDAQFDDAMAELEAMKTGECKIMFPDQSNIDEKKAHERKVKACLRSK